MRVTSSADPSYEVLVTLEDAPIVIVVLSGAIGGSGFADGIGALAKFRALGDIEAGTVSEAFLSDEGIFRKIDLLTYEITTVANLLRREPSRRAPDNVQALLDGPGRQSRPHRRSHS